jgi:hypothetical protein
MGVTGHETKDASICSNFEAVAEHFSSIAGEALLEDTLRRAMTERHAAVDEQVEGVSSVLKVSGHKAAVGAAVGAPNVLNVGVW